MNAGYFLLFFDLPTLDEDYAKKYRHLIKALLKQGFVRVQKSVFCRVRKEHDDAMQFGQLLKTEIGNGFGEISLLSVGKNEFESMYMVCGDAPIFTNESVFVF